MRDDLEAALRSLRSSRGFTIVALIVLTLGIGATTAIFSVVDAVVLRGLPFDEHDRLVALANSSRPGPRRPTRGQRQRVHAVSPQNYLDWVAGQRVLRVDGGDRQRLADAADARRRARVAGPAAGHRELLRRPAGATGPGPRVYRRERGRRSRPGRRPERRPVAPPVWRRPERHRPRHPARGRRRGGRKPLAASATRSSA